MVLSATRVRLSGLAAILGGVLWVPYGVFEMLEPWGPAVIYRDDLGYQLVTEPLLFLAYSLPGSLALLLTSLGLLGIAAHLGLPATRLGRAAGILAYVAVGLGVLSLAGVVVLFGPVFTSGRIFGSLALGTATFLAGIAAQRAGVQPVWTLGLLALGSMGIFLLPLWPLVYAVDLLPTTAGAAFMALYGLGWIGLGIAIWWLMGTRRTTTGAFPNASRSRPGPPVSE